MVEARPQWEAEVAAPTWKLCVLNDLAGSWPPGVVSAGVGDNLFW